MTTLLNAVNLQLIQAFGQPEEVSPEVNLKDQYALYDQAVIQVVVDHLKHFKMPDDLLQAKNDKSKWKLVSGMQKAIRHGDVERAMNNAHAGAMVDATYTFRRLGIAAIEDVGLGNMPALMMVLAVMSAKQVRDNMGAVKLAVMLAKELAESHKDRMACELCVLADFDKTLAEKKQAWINEPVENLVKIAEDQALSYTERQAAIWMAAGTKRFYGNTMPVENDRSGIPLLKYLVKLLPAWWGYAAYQISARLNEGMFVSLYLMHEMASMSNTWSVSKHEVPPTASHLIGLLNASAYDMHTREGKMSFSMFRKKHPELMSKFGEGMTTSQMDATLGAATFVIEGGVLKSRMDYHGTDWVYPESHRLELGFNGLPESRHEGFVEYLKSNLTGLNKAREVAVWVTYKKAEEEQQQAQQQLPLT